MADSKLEIQILARNLAKEALKAAQEELKAVGNAAKKSGDDGEKGSKKFKLALTEIKAGVDLAMGAFSKFKETAVAAFEFAEAGAQIRQTKDSFADLGISIESMRSAVNGTVPDMTLMSGALTLNAGASKTMQAAYTAAVPQLLQMSKAASKLNPSLGDTTYMFQSLSTAAKKQSSMIADNLGIVVKQGVAYQEYAKSINKSVDALTDEEKSLAFLNELLKSGNTLIEQAGGNVDSLTDSYSRVRTNLENATNGLKEQTGAAGGLVDAIATLTGNYSKWYEAANATGKSVIGFKGTLESVQLVLTGTNATIEKYNSATYKMGEVTATAAESMKAYIASLPASFENVGSAMRNAGYEASVWGELSRSSSLGSMDALNQYNQAIAAQEAASVAAAAEQIALAEAERAAQVAAADAAAASLQFAAGLGEVGKQAFVNMQLETLNSLYKEGTIDQHTYRAAQLELMKQSGLLTQAELNAAAQMASLNQQLADGSIRASDYANQLLNLQKNIDGLHDKTVRITVETAGGIPVIPAGPEGKGVVGAMASGGVTPRSGVYLAGEREPELVELPAGSRVYNGQETRQILNGEGGVRIESLTIQVQGPTLGSRSEARELAHLVYEELGAMLKPLGSRA